MGTLLNYLFCLILIEISILMFLLFRLLRRSCLLQMILAVFSFMAPLMFILSVAVIFGEGSPLAFDTDDVPFLVGGAIVLTGIIIVLARMREWPYADTAAGDAARERDAANPRSKRSIFVDLVGCGLLGAILLVLLVVAIAAAIAMFG